MFGHEWNEQEERKALLETGELRGEARGEARGIAIGETMEKIKAIQNLILQELVNFDDLKSSGKYAAEELAAISKSI